MAEFCLVVLLGWKDFVVFNALQLRARAIRYLDSWYLGRDGGIVMDLREHLDLMARYWMIGKTSGLVQISHILCHTCIDKLTLCLAKMVLGEWC